MNAPGSRVRRIELHPENELRRHQYRLQRQPDARLEARVLGALPVERQQWRQVVGRNRPPIGAVREVGDDLLRASLFLGRRGRMAEEYLVAALGYARPLHIVRADHGYAADALEVVLVVPVTAALGNDLFGDHGVFQECRQQRVGARLDRQADFHVRIGIVSGAETAIACLNVACALFGRNGEQPEPLIVEPQIDLAFLPHAQELIGLAARQADRNLIFAVHRETVANGRASARAERHVFAHAVALIEPVRNRIGLIGDGRLGIAHRQPADLACRGKVPFHQQGRYLQHVADIVEAVAGIIGRQHLRHVDLDRQQIADDVGVFRAVEAMERRMSGIGLDLRHPIALGLDRLDQGLVGRCVGPRHAGRRHLAAAQLAQQLLPNGALVVEIGEIQRLQVQSRPCLGTEMAGVAIYLPGSPD